MKSPGTELVTIGSVAPLVQQEIGSVTLNQYLIIFGIVLQLTKLVRFSCTGKAMLIILNSWVTNGKPLT